MDIPTLPIENELREHRLVHTYGPSIDLSMLRILDIIMQVNTEGIVFCCYKTSILARHAYNMELELEGRRGSEVGLATGDRSILEKPEYDLNENRIIYCTTGKMNNILIDLIKRNRTQAVGWLLIQSWDEYDVNAYIVANLAKLNTTASITLLSCSEWSPLPYNESVSVPYPHPGHLIEYTKRSVSDLASRGEGGIFYGPEELFSPIRGGNVERRTKPGYSDLHLVIDTLKDSRGRPITKHLADLRADTIRTGIVYRQGTVGYFNGLKARNTVRPDVGLEEAIVLLKHSDIDPAIALGPNHPQEEYLRISTMLSTMGVASSDLSKVISLRLSAAAGIFYAKWLALARERRGTGEVKRVERDRYIPGLISCLIERPPSYYSEPHNYNKFVGRNDIETLCNMWSSLILSHSGPFWTWTRDRPILNWCNENSFDFNNISRLFINMKRVCVGMRGEGGLFNNIKTSELNMATEVFKIIEGDEPKKIIKWNRSKTLPTRHLVANKNVLPVLHSGKVLDIYVDRDRVYVKPVIVAENVSLFFGL